MRDLYIILERSVPMQNGDALLLEKIVNKITDAAVLKVKAARAREPGGGYVPPPRY